MDDFGSGYSSLNMLKEAPVDEIKLDMRFLSAADPYGRAEEILHMIITMGNHMTLFDEGVAKLNAISVAAKEVSELVATAPTPKWLKEKPLEDFDNMKKDISLSANALAVASKAGAQMLQAGKLTAGDISTMASYSKEANNYLGKTISMLNKFKDGYGVDKK